MGLDKHNKSAYNIDESAPKNHDTAHQIRIQISIYLTLTGK